MAELGGKAAIDRRDFLRIGGASAAALGATTELAAGGASSATSMNPATSPAAAELAPETKYPKLAIITPYSPQKLAFATATGYEGVVIPLDDFFDPDKLTDSQIDQIMAASRETGARIISIECMWGLNHIHPNPAEREKVHARFIRCLEFAHRLGCKFCGTFSGGMPGAPADRQVNQKILAGTLPQQHGAHPHVVPPGPQHIQEHDHREHGEEPQRGRKPQRHRTRPPRRR